MTSRCASLIALGLCMLSALASCGKDSTNVARSGGDGETHWLIIADPCKAESCGTVPESLRDKPVVHCEIKGMEINVEPNALAQCVWETHDENEETDSAKACTDTECGTKPAADCPTGSHLMQQACHNVNDTGCRWYTSCETQKSGRPCNTHADCPSGICEGPGCGELGGVCQEEFSVQCSDDSRPYCGCDGKTFRSSGSCPGERYAHRGECSAE